MKTLVFFNNKGGVGKTTLVYHLAWMLNELGLRVVAADLDPQGNLTSAFLPEERLEELWPKGDHPKTILGALKLLAHKLGDLRDPNVEEVADGLGIIPGDLGLSMFEDRLADAWTDCLDDNEPNAHDAFRVTTAFYRAMESAAKRRGAQIVLVDVGPNLGAINRAALVASDYVVVPLGADLFSLQGLRNLGPTLRQWRQGWKKRCQQPVPPGLSLPSGEMRPLGYVIMQPAMRANRPVKAYMRWADRIPEEYTESVSGPAAGWDLVHDPDPHNMATLKHYRSLMPLAQDARKPMFLLKPADGAMGAHTQAVAGCYQDFEDLARRVADACALGL